MIQKYIQLFLFLCVISTAQGQLTENKNLYTIKAEGNDKLKIRMFTDYSKIEKGMDFYLVFYFDLNYQWYTYSDKVSKNHLPLTIDLHLPENLIVTGRFCDKPIRAQDAQFNEEIEMYKTDFCFIYQIRHTGQLKKLNEIKASIRWQCCNKTICTVGDAVLTTTIEGGKAKKSKLNQDIKTYLNQLKK